MSLAPTWGYRSLRSRVAGLVIFQGAQASTVPGASPKWLPWEIRLRGILRIRAFIIVAKDSWEVLAKTGAAARFGTLAIGTRYRRPPAASLIV